MHNIHKLSLVLSFGLAAAHAQASTLTLPLGNLRSGANIDSYFVGGNDSVPTDGTGPDLGFTFSSNATAQKAGSSQGRFENEPSTQGEVLFFSSSTSAASTMDFAAGFTGLSFDYSIAGNNSNLGSTAAYNSGTVDIWSGLNGTGMLLDTLMLTPVSNPVACQTHGDSYCNWSLATTGTTNFGTAESVTFGPNAVSSVTEFDDVQLSPSPVPVPLPAAAWLMVSGIAGLGGLARRRRATG
jgi:hypothetical protein